MNRREFGNIKKKKGTFPQDHRVDNRLYVSIQYLIERTDNKHRDGALGGPAAAKKKLQKVKKKKKKGGACTCFIF